MQAASTNICERMGRSQELSEFQRGAVIGSHLCKKSSWEISSLLIPQSTVSGVISGIIIAYCAEVADFLQSQSLQTSKLYVAFRLAQAEAVIAAKGGPTSF